MWNAQQVADWNAAADSERSLCVAWLLNPGEAARQNIRVTVHGDHITDVTPVADDQRAEILPVALLPRLLNAHTHLEFSTLSQPLAPSTPFTDWIQSVIRHRRQHAGESADGTAAGLAESFRNGTAFVGEITTAATTEAYRDARVNVLSFRELIGLLPEHIDAQLAAAARHLSDSTTSSIRRGLSPHAPYSVHPELFAATVDLARHYDVPVAMHLAETRDELLLLDCGSGPFVEFLTSLNLWRPNVLRPNSAPLHYLQKLAEVPGSLAIHGNYFNDAELTFLTRNPQVATVYCPRTHNYFGHSPHPWLRLLKEGATVVIGTDSRASNPDLSVWKELQFLARMPNTLPWPQLLELATTKAAHVFGRQPQRLRPGQSADGLLVLCRCDSASGLDSTLSAEDSQAGAVLCSGRITPTTQCPGAAG